MIRNEKESVRNCNAYVLRDMVQRYMVERLLILTLYTGFSNTTDVLDAFYKKVKFINEVTITTLVVKIIEMTLTRHLVVNSSCKDGIFLHKMVT